MNTHNSPHLHAYIHRPKHITKPPTFRHQHALNHHPPLQQPTQIRMVPSCHTLTDPLILSVQPNSSFLYRLTLWFIAFCSVAVWTWILAGREEKIKEPVNNLLLWLYSTLTMALSCPNGDHILFGTGLGVFLCRWQKHQEGFAWLQRNMFSIWSDLFAARHKWHIQTLGYTCWLVNTEMVARG